MAGCDRYFQGMVTTHRGLYRACIPTRAAKLLVGAAWVHEIKHDGYCLIVRRDGENVRLFTRRGYDWRDRVNGGQDRYRMRRRVWRLPGLTVGVVTDLV
jgi:hypothetical protein